MYFTEKHLADLTKGYQDVHQTFGLLRDRYVTRSWTSADARGFAVHGLGRRLGTLIRTIENVWSILPPELEEIPERDSVVDATINLHAFIINVFGCLDNLAWIWVYERGVKDADGTPLNPLRVGLGKKNLRVRASSSDQFRNYLDGREGWITHLRGFRDSLAHRIPLYVPPFVIHPDRLDRYQGLERDMASAISVLDLVKYRQLADEQQSLGVFRPWMARSMVEAPEPAVLHPQLIADFLTVDEIARKMLDELDKPIRDR